MSASVSPPPLANEISAALLETYMDEVIKSWPIFTRPNVSPARRDLYSELGVLGKGEAGTITNHILI